MLPSINMIDGKAKQFDDGLAAALHLRALAGPGGGFKDLTALLKDLLARLDAGGRAYAWIWSGLKLGGCLTPVLAAAEPAGAAVFIQAFDAVPARSKPVGFYDWSPELARAFRLARYFQESLPADDPRALEIVAALKREPSLLPSRQRLQDLFLGLSVRAAQPKDRLSLLPNTAAKEDLLFRKLFGGSGLPEGSDLMMELVKAIRSGNVDLKPGAQAGWHDYAVYALETFLLPERGAENQKLLLTKKYKERMLQAFAALLTKRRETQSLMLGGFVAGAAWDPGEPPKIMVAPRLRLEPNPTYYLRMARSYSFLETFLRSTLSAEDLDIPGLKEGGRRALPVGRELSWIKDLFYGLHLVSCEDIGMRPQLLEGEPVERERVKKAAEDWLAFWRKDPDLAVDTRVITPILFDPRRGITRSWSTLGVRGAKLSARYERAPKWRPDPARGPSDWIDVPAAQLEGQDAVILVDEFAEVETPGPAPLARDQLRRIADREKTKENIVRALAR